MSCVFRWILVYSRNFRHTFRHINFRYAKGVSGMPALKHNALSAAKVRTLKEPGAYSDGNGLTLRVDPSGNKSWFQRVTVNGRRSNIGLGGYPAVSLHDAREAAIDNLSAIRRGIDPIAEKRAEKEKAGRPSVPPFQIAARTVITLHSPTWSSDRHAKQWTESLVNHVYPLIGQKQVDEITTADTMAVLEPIWLVKIETAKRVRQRMETIFDYAIAQGWRNDNPSAAAIIKALPPQPKTKEHHPALPYVDVPEAIKKVRASTAYPTTKLAFEFMVLTAARAGEARGANWTEINMGTSTWTMPAERIKTRFGHRVPLSFAALDVLRQARDLGDGGLVFPSILGQSKTMSNAALEELLKRLKIDGVPHGFRSSFKDWAAEQTNFSPYVSEAALAHQLGTNAERPYLRTDLFQARRELMDAWAAFVCPSAESPVNVADSTIIGTSDLDYEVDAGGDDEDSEHSGASG